MRIASVTVPHHVARIGIAQPAMPASFVSARTNATLLSVRHVKAGLMASVKFAVETLPKCVATANVATQLTTSAAPMERV